VVEEPLGFENQVEINLMDTGTGRFGGPADQLGLTTARRALEKDPGYLGETPSRRQVFNGREQ